MVIRDMAVGTDLEIVLRGDIPPAVREYARDMLTSLACYTDLHLRHVRVRVTLHGETTQVRRVTAQASAQFDGRRVRAQVAAGTAHEAIDLLADVMRHRMSRLEQRWEADCGGTPSTTPHGWRHDHEQTHRPGHLPRPHKDRKILRHKAFELDLCTPDEAIEDMELMGYRFRLFTDLESGQDSVVCRLGPTAYRLTQVKPEPGHIWRTRAAMTTSPYPASRLSLEEAVELMNLTGWSFVFYADPATGRGRVLYRRYDGHYGLITPVGTWTSRKGRRSRADRSATSGSDELGSLVSQGVSGASEL
jgi:ribosome-associated translation inhibitor RaiA